MTDLTLTARGTIEVPAHSDCWACDPTLKAIGHQRTLVYGVVKGEPPPLWGSYAHGHGLAPTVPPAEWVAAAQPCPTCDGEGVHSQGDPYPCPKCNDGRPRITIRYECRTLDEPPPDDIGIGYLLSGTCWDCHRHYTKHPVHEVPGVVTHDPVPIVHDYDAICSAYEGPAAVEVTEAGAIYWPAWSGAQEYDDGTPLDGITSADIGDFVILAQEATDD